MTKVMLLIIFDLLQRKYENVKMSLTRHCNEVTLKIIYVNWPDLYFYPAVSVVGCGFDSHHE